MIMQSIQAYFAEFSTLFSNLNVCQKTMNDITYIPDSISHTESNYNNYFEYIEDKCISAFADSNESDDPFFY